MIEISYREFRQGNFLQAFDRLCNNSTIKGSTSYNIAKIAEKLRPMLRDATASFSAILREHAELLENGSLKPSETGGPGSFQIKETHVESYKKALEVFDANVAKVDRFKIAKAELDDARLAATEWEALEPILKE